MPLTTTRYVPPGTYIGQILQPQPGEPTGNRALVVIGRGSPYMLAKGLGIRRAYVYEEQLTFPQAAPYQATLQHTAKDDQQVARLYTSDGVELRTDQWRFIGGGTGVEINPEVFDPNATYLIDYQSTDRNVQDPIPVDNIREILSVGSGGKYKELEHFWVPGSVTGPTADSVANTQSQITTPTADAGNSGDGSFTVAPDASYTGKYNRVYTLTVVNVSGAAPNRQATVQWAADRVSPGNDDLDKPSTPMPGGTPPTFVLDESNGQETVTLEYGIKLVSDWGAAGYAQNDVFKFEAQGPALVETDPRNLPTAPQFAQFGTVTANAGNTGNASVALADAAKYTGERRVRYHLECVAVNAGTDATFGWEAVGGQVGQSGTVNVQYASPTGITIGSDGLVLDFDFSGGDPAVGDRWTVDAIPARVPVTAKDDRQYTLTVTNAADGTLTGTYVAPSREGGYGSWSTDWSTYEGRIDIRNNIILWARNIGGFSADDHTRHVADDRWTWSWTLQDVLDWSLQEEVVETISTDQLLLDVTGAITGYPNTWYLILAHTPDTILEVVDATTGTAISYTHIADTPYIYFASPPSNNVQVTYRWRTEEPDPGELYELTANYVRPDEYYNRPLAVYNLEGGRALLAPATVDNHLYLMNEIKWKVAPSGMVYFIQVKDADGDGVYTRTDFAEAINAAEGVSRVADVVVLASWQSLPDALAHVDKMNDPFERKPRILYVGAPQGTPIGDVNTAGSLVYTAKKTLQVSPDSVAHGTRVMVGSTWAKLRVLLSSGVETEVTLDGSFVAGAVAAMVAGFDRPDKTILRRRLYCFSDMETFGEIDDPRNRRLGEASIIYFTKQGDGVFRIEEDVTVDTYTADTHQLMSMTQKQFMTRWVIDEMDAKLPGVVVESAEDGIAVIKGFLRALLEQAVGLGYIGRYQDDQGRVRPINPDQDIVVFQDEQDPTKYYFYYAYWLKSVMKRLFGLYMVNSNDFGRQLIR